MHQKQAAPNINSSYEGEQLNERLFELGAKQEAILKRLDGSMTGSLLKLYMDRTREIMNISVRLTRVAII